MLDAERLSALREAMGEGLGELVSVFLASAHEIIGGMRKASAHDREALYRQAHTLKASAANVGAVRLSALARKLESVAREAEESVLAAAIEQIEQALDAVEIPLRTEADAGSCELATMG